MDSSIIRSTEIVHIILEKISKVIEEIIVSYFYNHYN
jgi:hypothetical protein